MENKLTQYLNESMKSRSGKHIEMLRFLLGLSSTLLTIFVPLCSLVSLSRCSKICCFVATVCLLVSALCSIVGQQYDLRMEDNKVNMLIRQILNADECHSSVSVVGSIRTTLWLIIICEIFLFLALLALSFVLFQILFS